MKLRLIVSALLVSVAVVAAACGGDGGDSAEPAATDSDEPAATDSDEPAATDLRFVYIQALGDPYHLTVFRGAFEKGEELGVTVERAGPNEYDIDAQIAAMRSVIVTQPDGILLGAAAEEPLRPIMEEAVQAGIPVLAYGTAVPGGPQVSTVLSDHFQGGLAAGRSMCDALAGREGTVFIAQANPGIQLLIDRWNGFKEGIKQNCPDVRIDEDLVSCDPAQAVALIRGAMTRTDYVGFYADASCTAISLGTALGESGIRPEDVVVVLYDADPSEVALLQAGTADALIAQKAYEVGALATEYLWKHLNGEDVPPQTTLDNVVMTRANFEETQQWAYQPAAN